MDTHDSLPSIPYVLFDSRRALFVVKGSIDRSSRRSIHSAHSIIVRLLLKVLLRVTVGVKGIPSILLFRFSISVLQMPRSVTEETV